MRHLALIAALASLATPAWGQDPAEPVALYGPTIRTPGSERRLLWRMDEGPTLSTRVQWFAQQTWLAQPTAIRVVGATPEDCPTPTERTPRAEPHWDRLLTAGTDLAAAQLWKAAREALEPALDPACVKGPTPDRETLHAALIDLARAAWLGYPADERLARDALEAAVRVAPEAVWRHPGEAELETAWLGYRDELVQQESGEIFAVTSMAVYVDGERLRQEPTAFVPGLHLLELRDEDGRHLRRARVRIRPGDAVLIGSPEELWPWVSGLGAPASGRDLHGFARRALASSLGEVDGYWLLLGGRPVRVERSGAWHHPRWRGRFVVGVGGRAVWRDNDPAGSVPELASKLSSAFWFGPHVTLGFQARTRPGGPLVGLRISGTWSASPLATFAAGRAVQLLPSLRLGPTFGTAGARVRFDVAVYGDLAFAGRQAVPGPEGSFLRNVTFVGATGETLVAFRTSRLTWLTVATGGGWVGAATASISVGVELRAWKNR